MTKPKPKTTPAVPAAIVKKKEEAKSAPVSEEPANGTDSSSSASDSNPGAIVPSVESKKEKSQDKAVMHTPQEPSKIVPTAEFLMEIPSVGCIMGVGLNGVFVPNARWDEKTKKLLPLRSVFEQLIQALNTQILDSVDAEEWVTAQSVSWAMVLLSKSNLGEDLHNSLVTEGLKATCEKPEFVQKVTEKLGDVDVYQTVKSMVDVTKKFLKEGVKTLDKMKE